MHVLTFQISFCCISVMFFMSAVINVCCFFLGHGNHSAYGFISTKGKLLRDYDVLNTGGCSVLLFLKTFAKNENPLHRPDYIFI